ncbi:MAG: VWA domain-containing protein, partial [Candidatus Polarisedimenticolia bacterium]
MPPVPEPKTAAGRDQASPRRVDLRLPLTRPEEEALAREVPRFVREIRLKAGRRRRRSRRGRLWPARVMRASLTTGGVPFDLPMRAPRPRRPRVVVMVDVSWSVLRASSLFLSMSKGFLARGARASVWLFVDRCVDATARLAGWKDHTPGGWAAFLEGLPDLDPRAASDYGRAFHQAFGAMGSRGVRALRRDTILVVLGDARSNQRDPLAWVFEDMAARCRRVIWLDPEPAELWGTGDSALAAYLPACDVVCEARDLEGIARGVAEIARAL